MQPAPLSEECQTGCNDAEAHCILNLQLCDVKEVASELMNERSQTPQKRTDRTSLNKYAEKLLSILRSRNSGRNQQKALSTRSAASAFWWSAI